MPSQRLPHWTTINCWRVCYSEGEVVHAVQVVDVLPAWALDLQRPPTTLLKVARSYCSCAELPRRSVSWRSAWGCCRGSRHEALRKSCNRLGNAVAAKQQPER